MGKSVKFTNTYSIAQNSADSRKSDAIPIEERKTPFYALLEFDSQDQVNISGGKSNAKGKSFAGDYDVGREVYRP